MKNLLTTTLALFLTGACFHTLQACYAMSPEELKVLDATHYDGPKDETVWQSKNMNYYPLATGRTQLGVLAVFSDIIGVGQVSGQKDDHFTVTIDHAIIGCTNGASIVVYHTGLVDEEKFEGDKTAYMPTNHSRIVFAANTNHYNDTPIVLLHPAAPFPIRKYPQPELPYLNRSWWYADRDDGLLFTQFTNVIQALRPERNWTNYFYVTRDGVLSASNRVREDSFWEMRGIIQYATPEQKDFIFADPLVHDKHKAYILWLNKPQQ